MRRALGLLGVATLLASGCGGDHAHRVLSQTAARLGDIHSGRLEAKLLVQPRGLEGSRPFGFELRGPFELRRGAPPLLHVAYTQIASGKQATVTVTSTGTRAFVTSGGKEYPIDVNALAQLSPGGSRSSSNGVELDLDTWVEHPKTTGCRTSAPVELDCVKADVAVARAANDLLALARRLTGRNLPQLQGDEAKRLQNAVDSATIRVESGRRDHLLRLLALRADLGVDVPKEIRRALAGLAGADFTFELRVRNPNVRVQIPGA